MLEDHAHYAWGVVCLTTLLLFAAARRGVFRGSSRGVLLAVLVLPVVASAGLGLRAPTLISTWDLRPGAPEAPLFERLVVAAWNWSLRMQPFWVVAGYLTLGVAFILRRRLLRGVPPETLRVDALVWGALAACGLVAAHTLDSVLRRSPNLYIVLLPMAQWVAVCLCAAAAEPCIALLTRTGNRRRAALVSQGEQASAS